MTVAAVRRASAAGRGDAGPVAGTQFIVSCALWCVSCAPWVVGVITAFRAGNQPQPARDVAVSGVLRHEVRGGSARFVFDIPPVTVRVERRV